MPSRVDKNTTFRPLPWQFDPWRDRSPVLLLTGAAGGGKSRLAGEKLHAYMMKYPGATGIVGRKDKTAAFKSVVPLLRYTIMGDTNWGTYHKSEGLFEYNNGSMLWVAGVRDESQRENLRSIGKDGSADIMWWEEANKLTEADDAEITARMRGHAAPWRQRIYTTNPDHPQHWIKLKLIDGKRASVYYSRPEDNPSNPPDYIEGLKGLTGLFYQRLWLGLWVQAEGAIYPDYNSTIHLLDKRIATPVDGRYIISIDFGYTAPFSCTLWRIIDNKIYQVKQLYRTKRLVEEHAVDIRRMLASVDIPINRVEAWICDHDAEGRATLEKHLGIRTRTAFKDIKPGIEAVQSRFKKNTLFLNVNAVDDPDEELEKNYLPTCTADEVPAYVWSDKKQDTPVDENNHGCDEMRYLVAYVDKVSRTMINVNTKAIIKNYITGRTQAR